MNLLFRADATSVMGTGHLMRCLAIAEEYLAQDADCHFALSQAPEGLILRLEQFGAHVHRLRRGDDADELARLLEKLQARLIFVDGYHFAPDYRALLWDNADCCVALDDFVLGPPYHAHAILNSHPSALPVHYPGMSPEQLLLGLDYAPMRQEFQHPLNTPLADRGRVLLNMGGSDPADLSASLALCLLDELPESVGIDLVVGASNPRRESLLQLGQAHARRLEVHLDTPHMARLMGRAGMAVAAAGSTLWELAVMGVPSVVLVVADNQSPALLPPIRDWFIALDTRGNPGSISQVSTAATRLWGEAHTREGMFRTLTSLPLGQGCTRIRESVERVLAR